MRNLKRIYSEFFVQKLFLIIINHLLLSLNKGIKIMLPTEHIAIFEGIFQLYIFEIPQLDWNMILSLRVTYSTYD